MYSRRFRCQMFLLKDFATADLSGGAIAGIVIGCVVGVALIAALALYLTRHHDFAHSSRV